MGDEIILIPDINQLQLLAQEENLCQECFVEIESGSLCLNCQKIFEETEETTSPIPQIHFSCSITSKKPQTPITAVFRRRRHTTRTFRC
ncbi:MAG: hypothetical protein KAS02_02110 [Candidatus Pacebacteria bacterium]|nr:hypothetical protein [Candidatus Paceibacterota bacterium]